jgi:hypothetical protein
MNGELAQYFALATHATGWLRDPQAATPGFDASRSVVQFVKAINFDGIAGVDGWMRHLASEGVNRVWLAVPSLDPADDRVGLATHQSAAFVGGLQAGLLTASSSGNRLWQARWQVGDRDAPDRRIWTVAYQSHPVAFGRRCPAGRGDAGPGSTACRRVLFAKT